jgi:hypothetical protein
MDKKEFILNNNKQDSIVCDRYIGDYILNSMDEYAKQVSIGFTNWYLSRKDFDKSIELLYIDFLKEQGIYSEFIRLIVK